MKVGRSWRGPVWGSSSREAGAIRIPPGARVVSDPVCFDLKALENLAISLFLPHETPIGTIHREGRQAAFISQAGNFVDETVFEAADTNTARMLLSGVMVDAAPEAQAIVLFGDSITDGDGSTPDENRRYPDVLARASSEAGAWRRPPWSMRGSPARGC